ncbi:MAG TPA: acyl carrier protein [Bryobacteraceae bacterium]|nr:acyl carrier protein [Bryobacteraceae bacterium]
MLDRQLLDIFRNVFPTLTDAEIQSATTDRLAAWDSMASVNLFLQIQQELGLPIDFEEAAALTSYSTIREYVQARRA